MSDWTPYYHAWGCHVPNVICVVAIVTTVLHLLTGYMHFVWWSMAVLVGPVNPLTHWGWDKNGRHFLQMTFPNAFLFMKIFLFWFTIHWNLFPIDTNLSMVQKMAWCWIGVGGGTHCFWYFNYYFSYSSKCVKNVFQIALKTCDMDWIELMVKIRSNMWYFKDQWLGTAIHHLTLYVLNFSEGTLTYIYILCHFSTLIRHR